MSLLQSKRDHAAIRDLCERWLREILASPIDPDPHERSQRAIVLGHLALTLTTLPAPVAFDAELAVLAAREAAELDKGWYGRTILGAFLCRMGRLDEALHALKASAQQTQLGWWQRPVLVRPGRNPCPPRRPGTGR